MSNDNVTLTPTFIVYVNGTRLGVDHEASVKQIRVQDTIDEPSRCHLILSDMNRTMLDTSDFELAQTLSVHLGFKDAVEEVFWGEITGHEMKLKKGSDATCLIHCQDKMARLNKTSKYRLFNEMTDADIVSEIASEYGLKAECEALTQTSIVRVQHGLSDFEFIRDLAKEYNLRFLVKEQQLYLVEDRESSDSEIVLEWGKTLVDFEGRSQTTSLLTEVEVTGWDALTGEGFSSIATNAHIVHQTGSGSTGAGLVEEFFNPRKKVLIDEQCPDAVTGENKALACLTRNSYEFMAGLAVCEGENRLRAGLEIQIKEVGGRYSGPWLVKSVDHIFHASFGYSSRCKLFRNAQP